MSVAVNVEQIENLGEQVRLASITALYRLAERGEQLLVEEVPKETHNLSQGVSSEVDEGNLSATLIVSATSGRTGGAGTLVLPSGKTKSITLRAQKPFNYAEAVAKGRAAIRPKNGRMLIIPVASAPIGGSYIKAGGKIFIVRPSAKAVAANPYDERAAKRLEGEAENIVGAVFEEEFK